MTDPTGLCFLSYRRTRAAEAALLVGALRDRGIPTWQDIADLPTTPTEAELRRVLADPNTASGILFTTPEVEDSPIIRDVEAPGIIDRHLQADGFFAVPVAAGGLDYADIPRILGPRLGLAHLPGWNVHRTKIDPIDSATAGEIADIVLGQRLTAIHNYLPMGEPLRILVATRAPLPKSPGPALALDLTHRFTGRTARIGAWSDAILPAFRSIVRTIGSRAPGRRVELSGSVAISAATAFGAAFLSVAGIPVTWVQEQHSFGKPSEAWSLNRARETSGFRVANFPHNVGSTDIALLVSVAANVSGDFNSTLAGLPRLRAAVSIAPGPGGGGTQRIVLTAGQAVDVAHIVVDALRAVRASYGAAGTVHLFMAVPVGLAMMIGQLLNTFGPVQTYEHLPGDPVPYERAALLTPSI